MSDHPVRYWPLFAVLGLCLLATMLMPVASAPLTIPCQNFDYAVHALLSPKVPRPVALVAIRAEAPAGAICRMGGADVAAVLDAAGRLWDVAARYKAVMK